MSASSAELEHSPFRRHGLPTGARGQAAGLLNRRLADAIDLLCQCKQARWNVKGPEYVSLHVLFGEIHAEVTEYVDRIGTRVVQLGGTAEGTVRLAAERSELTEYPTRMWKGSDHVKSLGASLASFRSRMRLAAQAMDELQDAVSAELCTEISSSVDRSLWFVEAHAPES
jgi:starvation-inducible DNA-binding protein